MAADGDGPRRPSPPWRPSSPCSTDSSDDVLAAVYAAAAGVVLLLIVLLFSYAARPWAVAEDTADAVPARTNARKGD